MPLSNRSRRDGYRTALIALGAVVFAGCHSNPPASSPRLGPVGQMERRTSADPVKPLPGPETSELPPPPFIDVPLVYQRPPEQKMFLDGYKAVGRPRLAVFVNRSLLGDALSIDAPPAADPASGSPFRDESGRPISYLNTGQYDEAHAKQIDYAAIENVLTQWLACEGQTTVASPAVVRERMTPEEIAKLQSGRPRMLGEVAQELNADVLIYAQARPTRQTAQGLEIRLNAEAININSSEQIARATVLIPPPLDSEQVNKYTRFIARKLMADMAMTWSGPGPARRTEVEREPLEGRSAPPVAPQPQRAVPGDETNPPRVAPPIEPPPVEPPPVEPLPGRTQPLEPSPPESAPPEPGPDSPPRAPKEKPSLLDGPAPPSVSRRADDERPTE